MMKKSIHYIISHHLWYLILKKTLLVIVKDNTVSSQIWQKFHNKNFNLLTVSKILSINKNKQQKLAIFRKIHNHKKIKGIIVMHSSVSLAL